VPRSCRVPSDSCLPDAARRTQVGAALAALLALGGDAVTRRGDVVSVHSSSHALVLHSLARPYEDAWAHCFNAAN